MDNNNSSAGDNNNSNDHDDDDCYFQENDYKLTLTSLKTSIRLIRVMQSASFCHYYHPKIEHSPSCLAKT